MQFEDLRRLVVDALEDIKGVDIKVIDVRGQTSIMDGMVIVSGTSHRHVKSLAQNVIRRAKEHNIQPFGVEGADVGDWVLVDLGDIVVHIMRPEVRSFYNLEKLWDLSSTDKASGIES
ncbi:MAG: ribosome silencing factor [Pseudomonadota bacterium]|nr:ribosome silencing factor [Pseudomonadota bacterium]